jgi:hypothetical protein
MRLGACPEVEGFAMRDESFRGAKRRNPVSAAEHASFDEFFEQMSPQLREAEDEETPENDVFWLLEENARLRSLAVKLSTLVGDLPDREWRNALAAADLAMLDKVRLPRP